MNNLRKYVLKTKYKKSVDCIINRFDRTGIDNLDKLANAPIHGHPCGIDIYDLVKEIRNVAKDWVEKPVKKKKEEEKLDE